MKRKPRRYLGLTVNINKLRSHDEASREYFATLSESQNAKIWLNTYEGEIFVCSARCTCSMVHVVGEANVSEVYQRREGAFSGGHLS